MNTKAFPPLREKLRVIHNTSVPKRENPQRSPITLVASGKGGVGKTWFSISIAQALSEKRQKVLLFDGDLGLANVDIQLGLMPLHDLAQVIHNQIPLNKAITPYIEGGFDIIAGQSGSGQLAHLPPQRLFSLKESLKRLSKHYAHVFVDLGAGVGETIKSFSDLAERCLILVTDEPTSLTDAYALIKILHLSVPSVSIDIIINQAESELVGQRTYNTLLKVCENFLGFSPPLLGIIRRDSHVKDSICHQTSTLTRFPSCSASKDIKKIAALL